MLHTIAMPGLLGDALIATPALYEFRRRLSAGDKIRLKVFHGIYDLFSSHEDADIVESETGEQWAERIVSGRHPFGQWYETTDGPEIILDAGVAFAIRSQAPTEIYPKHMMHGHALQLGVTITDPHYRVSIGAEEMTTARAGLNGRSGGRPVIVCTPYSRCCASRQGGVANKMLTFDVWEDVRRHYADRYHMLFVSGPDEPAVPEIAGDWEVGGNIRTVACWTKLAAACITLTNGVGHLAAAMDANIVRVQENMTLDLANFPTNGKYAVIDRAFSGGVGSVRSRDIIATADSLLGSPEC